MGWFANLKNSLRTIAQLANVNGIELPDDGRSSRDETNAGRQQSFLSGYELGEIAPGITFDTLSVLKALAIHNPDFSQAVTNNVALANTGHKVTINAVNSRQGEQAILRLQETARRIYPNSLGVDGLLNDAIAQAATFGAFSREDVVDVSARRVKEVVLVPVEEIRFRPFEGEWRPFQRPMNGLTALTALNANAGMPGYVELNPVTYRYFRLRRVDRSPYGLPPFCAALGPLLDVQVDMTAQLKRIVQKFGLFGMLNVDVVPPTWDRSKETHEEYTKRAQRYLQSIRQSFESAVTQGKLRNLTVSFRDQKVSTTPTTSDSRGANELWELNEDQVFSGLSSMGFMFGRNRTSTETFADVTMAVLAAQAENYQWLARYGLERTYMLDLMLAGIGVKSVDLKFNPIRSRNMINEAQANEINQRVAINDYKYGVIDADQFAQLRGYEKAHDPSRIDGSANDGASQSAGLSVRADNAWRATLSYDRQAGRYRFEPPKIELSTVGGVASDALLFDRLKKKARARRRVY
jgi:hypothetical protein